MHPDDLPPPVPAAADPEPEFNDDGSPNPRATPMRPPPSVDDLMKVIRRQARVIEMLQQQIGNIVLANTEQAAVIEEITGEPAVPQRSDAQPEG